jgi:2-hydroxychromene-2-carboxylate isomerase
MTSPAAVFGSANADVEFFFDPVCPWAWITSRWVGEVVAQRGLSIEWRPIALRILNEHKSYETDFPAGYIAGHTTGLKLLRVCAAAQQRDGNARVAELYTQFGADVHVRGRRTDMTDHWEIGFPDYLRSVGCDDELVAAAQDESLDAILRSSTEEALTRTGKDVGTPIISYRRGETNQSFFGPVMSAVPRGEAALRLWDAMWELATFPGFAELKRSLRERPQLDTSL